MLKIPTVDDWWKLTLKYPQFHHVSNSPLKDYGYMEAFAYLDDNPSATRILEFGHGFNPALFARYGAEREVWGLDDWQDLHYFPEKDEWYRKFDAEVRDKVPPRCKFVRGLLGNGVDVPENYFDVICSISVLEELPIDAVLPVIEHAARLLKSGGVLIGSHDTCAMQDERVKKYCEIQTSAGLELPDYIPPITFDHRTLIENPTAAMFWYQGQTPAERWYYGHWSTVWSIAKKQ